MVKEWHVWDFPDNIRVYFTDRFRTILYNRLKEICGTRIEIARRLGNNKETIRKCLYLGYRKRTENISIESYTSVKLIKEIIKIFGDQLGKTLLNDLEKNIIAIRAWNGWNVRNPILPFRESPKFYSIVFHILGDGNASKRHSPFYSNTSPKLIDNFIEDLQNFGKVEIQKIIRWDGLTVIKFPKVITDVLAHILNISFVRPQKLPGAILNATLKCKFTAIRAFADDEGSISNSGFVIKQKSRTFLEEFKLLLESTGIKVGKIGVDKNGIHRIFIWKESWGKFRDSIGFSHPRKEFILDDLTRV